MRITDLADSSHITGFSILTSDIKKVGYIFYENSFFENYLVLEYPSLERCQATSNILTKKGIKNKIRKTIKKRIIPINAIERVPLGGLSS